MESQRSDTKRLALWLLGAFITVGIVMAVSMTYGGAAQWMGGWGWMMPFGMMLMWAPIILVILLVVHLGHRAPESSPSNPEHILDARYARGDLSRDEYLRMREDLRTGRNR